MTVREKREERETDNYGIAAISTVGEYRLEASCLLRNSSFGRDNRHYYYSLFASFAFFAD